MTLSSPDDRSVLDSIFAVLDVPIIKMQRKIVDERFVR
jgi:hypothetical protein